MGRLKIEMLGTSFTIQANEDNQYLEKLLGYYQRITDDVKRIDSIKSPLQVAILSGIMICDELYKEKQNKIALENGESVAQISENSIDSDEIQRITLEMIKKIDKVL
ncbi:MAG: cell division protein ZapA [Treponema sp.]|nr:cell division protein ZapA [Spirochaetales bacterium]MDY4526043.1 cell division protein ZapA [Treponema sp.]MDY4832473.1 cell division protein ZapA [Treponema sp.]MDY6189573.1 cell division protein ZapA [Treponema sp.]